jgi:hypothetical protein
MMITTLQQHILQQQREVPYASGDFSWLMSGITLATRMIEAKIRSAGLSGIVGAARQMNIHDETQQKLDVYANEALLHCLGVRDCVAALVSEENGEPVTFNRAADKGKYVIVFDPLDGSSTHFLGEHLLCRRERISWPARLFSVVASSTRRGPPQRTKPNYRKEREGIRTESWLEKGCSAFLTCVKTFSIILELC